MSVSFFNADFNFNVKSGGPNFQMRSIDVRRTGANIRSAKAIPVLKGFDVEFTRSDHHFKRMFIEPRIMNFGPYVRNVDLGVTLGLRDNSGNWDDPYKGQVKYGVVVVDHPNVDVFNSSMQFEDSQNSGPTDKTSIISLNRGSHIGKEFLSGFDVEFENGDHHLLELGIGVEGRTLSVPVLPFPFTLPPQSYDAINFRLGLRDGSGFWDDSYGGDLHASILRFPAEVVMGSQGSLVVSGKGRGPISTTTTHYFQGIINPQNVFVGLTGFDVRFGNGDHHVRRIMSEVKILEVTHQQNRNNTAITIEYTGGLRDKSGNWDDPYTCRGFYNLIAIHDSPTRSVLPINIGAMGESISWRSFDNSEEPIE